MNPVVSVHASHLIKLFAPVCQLRRQMFIMLTVFIVGLQVYDQYRVQGYYIHDS